METFDKMHTLVVDALGHSNPVQNATIGSTCAETQVQRQAVNTFQRFLSERIQLLSKNQRNPTFFAQTGDSISARYVQMGVDTVSCVQQQPRRSLCDVYNALLQLNLLASGDQHQLAAINIIFILVGWLTMLYDPRTDALLTITQDGFKCFQHESLVTLLSPYASSHIKREIAENMVFLGLTTPKKMLADGSQGSLATHLDSRLLNANTICQYAGVNIEWSASLFCHMSFDESRRQLTLFALPSFCLLHSFQEKSLLRYLCEAIDALDISDTPDDTALLDNFLREVLHSLHMFFGADKRSRKYFFNIEMQQSQNAVGLDDPLLKELCTQKRPSILTVKELGTPTTGNFPILLNRLAKVQAFAQLYKPSRSRKLWSDRRDLNLTYTYRAVIVFGTIGVILSLAQTCLSAAQLIYSLQ